jgi:predicted aldo/keto reductase-like oxidoreductase
MLSGSITGAQPMEIRNLGQSGLRVSAIGLGCNNFGGRIDLEATRAVIHKAIDLGITLIFTPNLGSDASAPPPPGCEF